MTDLDKLDDSFSTLREEIKELRDSAKRVEEAENRKEPAMKIKQIEIFWNLSPSQLNSKTLKTQNFELVRQVKKIVIYFTL